MSAAGGRGRKHEEEEHENHERWLVSYADMVTLLMVTFIVMFAISQVDQAKFEQLKGSLSAGFGGPPNVVAAGGVGIMGGSGEAPETAGLIAQVRPDMVGPEDRAVELAKQQLTAEERGRADEVAAQARAELDNLNGVQERLSAALTEEGLRSKVDFRVTERGLDVILAADDVFFANASADLEPGGVKVLAAIGPVLADIDRPIDVEGHANHLPISGGPYPSNWELSAGRAASVVRYFVDRNGLDPVRLSATGFSSSRPLVPITDARALTVNRRTDVLIISEATPEVRALLPGLAEAAAG